MKIQIDDTNYEAFYLDFLEGNLSGDALAAFEAFMSAHPELALEDDAMIVLPASDETFDPIEKLALKKAIDLEDLTTETVSYFLIAREENLLSPQQEAQLENWLTANALYRNDAALFALAKVQPDTTQVYGAKASLKRKPARVIPMWWTGVAAAAAGVALIITLSVPDGKNQDGTTPVAQQGGIPSKDSVMKPASGQGRTTNENPNQQNTFHQGGQSNSASGNPTNTGGQISVPVIHPHSQHQAPNGNLAGVNQLEKRQAQKPYEEPTELAPLAVYQPTPKPSAGNTSAANNDVAWTPIDKMQNPVEPVTKKLASTLNTPVDFRTAKATKKKSGGFYLKIGKLEISHQSASL